MVHPKIELDGLTHAAEREWFVQRIGWVVWSGVILAALAGLLGPGPLSNTIATSPDGTVEILFNKFLHYHSPETLEVTLRPEGHAEGAKLFLSRSLLDNLEIRRTEPEPVEAILADDGVFYRFLTHSAADSVQVVFHVEYQKFGSISGEISLAEHPAAVMKQFVFP
jgi:hypothetical protein